MFDYEKYEKPFVYEELKDELSIDEVDYNVLKQEKRERRQNMRMMRN